MQNYIRKYPNNEAKKMLNVDFKSTFQCNDFKDNNFRKFLCVRVLIQGLLYLIRNDKNALV